MQKFRVELWRVVKFLLITLAVNLPIMFIWNALHRILLTQGGFSVGLAASVYSYSQMLVNAILLTLLHRYFTFRATEKWYIAMPIMIIANFAWQSLSSTSLILVSLLLSAEPTAADFALLVNARSVLWPILSYLLQRYVIYCHTTDTNIWYRRFHPAND